MIISIKEDTGEVNLISIYRDTYMTISSIREVSGLGFSFGRRNVKKLRQERKAEM